ASFTRERYEAFLADLHAIHPGAIEFRVAETPVFIPRALGSAMLDACEHIIDQILDPDFLRLTDASVPASDRVPGEIGRPQILTFDFGICQDAEGGLTPQLIEMQGFPSLLGFQAVYPEVIERHFPIPVGFSHYLSGLDREGFTRLLRDVLLGSHPSEEVVLLEIRPETQKTRIDFLCTRDLTGIEPLCLTRLLTEGERLYYEKDGRRIRIRRIYNRVIFDELHAVRDSLGAIPDLRAVWDVEWVPHPEWFYRVSKYTLPLLRHPNIPETWFLDQVKELPGDLSDFVLKPLFSFAGQGVVIDLQPSDIEAIQDPANWILQRKVRYADAVQTPDDPAKVEVRIMYLWREGDARPLAAVNLARLSKGKMIGVRYNKDREWVGGSVAYFEP
ncbi:MAG: hypothetical protein EBZ67_09785, partial [Chitinophagia bacterium]|nr:hypothetical protein [Chitinophagia bacterium]